METYSHRYDNELALGDTIWEVCCQAFAVFVSGADYCKPYLEGDPESMHLAACEGSHENLNIFFCPFCGTKINARLATEDDVRVRQA